MRIRISSTIDAPRETVFARMNDLDRAGEWMPGCMVERRTPGPVRVGARWRETRRVFGRDWTEEYEVALLDPPERIEVFADGRKGTTGRGEYRFRLEFEVDSASRTRVTMTGSATGMGVRGVILAPIMRAIMRRDMVVDLAAAKSWIERVYRTRPESPQLASPPT